MPKVNRLNIDWSHYLPLLGKKIDKDVAELIGCTVSVVRNRRVLLRIPPKNPNKFSRIDWKKYDKLFADHPDAVIVKIIGCSFTAVHLRRKKLASPVSTMQRLDWSNFDSKLGKFSDSVVAKAAGCSVSAVALRRSVLGIAAFRPLKKAHKAIDYEDLAKFIVPRQKPSHVAAKAGVSLASVYRLFHNSGIELHQKRHVNWTMIDPLLGTMPDNQLAQQAECSPQAISVRRRKMGVPKYAKAR